MTIGMREREKKDQMRNANDNDLDESKKRKKRGQTRAREKEEKSRDKNKFEKFYFLTEKKRFNDGLMYHHYFETLLDFFFVRFFFRLAKLLD